MSANVTVAQIMTSKVHTVSLTSSIAEAIDLILSKKIGGAPVVDGNMKVVTVISEGDLLKLAVSLGLEAKISGCLEKLVKREKLVTVKRNDTFADVYRLFLKHSVHRVVVVDDLGMLQGIVSRSNVLKLFVSQTKTVSATI